MADYNSIYTGAQIDSAIGALSTALQPSDISDFESSTQLNNRDSANRNRSNHTGTQLASTISDFETAVDNLTLDSANVLGLIDSAHVQLRQDYSYASLTGAPPVLSEPDVARLVRELGWGGDSATVLGLIDSAHVQLRQDYAYGSLSGAPTALSAFINDTLFLDSDTATQLIDSAYVQLRQDFAYASLTGVPASSAGVDSAAVIELIDSDYVQLRQDYAYGSLTDAPNVLDSADVALIAGDAGVDSATVLGLIDSAHVQLRQDYAYASLTGTPNVLDSADVSLIAGGLSGIDSAAVIGLIDSDYVQLRQDYAYGSLTGTPNVLDSADVSLIAGSSGGGVDSATVLGLIDSAHVQLRQDYAYGSLTGTPNVLDSADVSSIAGGLSGVDSAYVATQINALIDGAPGALDTLNEIAIAFKQRQRCIQYITVQNRFKWYSSLSSKLDTNQSLSLITTTVDSAYVQLRQSSVGPATFADLTEISLADLDVHDIAVPATSVHVITPNGSSAYRSDIHGTTDNPTLYVSAGETIAFDLTGVTGSHPFEIRSDASTAYNTGLIHIAPDGTRTTGSSAQGKTSGTLYWKVPGSINGTYKYRCTNHSGMIGDIIIDDPSADLDSAAVIGLIDSDYVQLRQDYAYASLTGTPNVLDSADVSTIAGSISGLDAAGVTALVDSDYVQLRQDYAYASLTGSPNVLDSADVSLIAGSSSAGVDSATVLGLIDSAHVQLRQDYAYASLTGAPNVLDSADVSLIAGEAGLDSALSIQLIDAKIQVLDIADIVGSSGNSGQYLKSLGSGDAEWANVLDSADVSLIAGSSAGVDSAYVTTQINALIDGAPGALNTLNELAAAINDDSQAYNTLLSLVNTKIDSADAITLITTTVDSAYVQLSAIGLPYSSLTGAPTLLDSALAQSLIDATAQTQDISDIVGAEGNSGEFLKSLGGGNATWVNISTVVDSAYVQLSAIGLPYTSLTGTPNVLDSADVSAIADSAYVLGLIDSAHVQLSAIGLPYTSLTGVPNVLDSADVSLIAGNAGTDSATVLGLIDSAHVQLRQDYAYASLTGAPGAGLDSALSQSLIDATVQVLDISDIVGAEGTSGQYLKSLGSGNAGWESFPTTLDSALTTQLIDSAYVQLSAIGLPYSSLTATPNLIDSALTTQLIDSAYVQLRSGGGGGGLSAWVEKTDAYTLVAGDRIVLDTRDSALSLTLPASPTFSDEVSIMDGTNYAATNNVTISGNGKKILASDSDFVINIDRASIDLMFYNDSQGWILTKAI